MRMSRFTWWLVGPLLTGAILVGTLAEVFFVVDDLQTASRGNDVLGLDLALLACLPLLFRRGRPLLTLTVSAVAVSALALLGYQAYFVTLTLLVGLSAVARRSSRSVIGLAVAIVMATGVILGSSKGESADLFAVLIECAIGLMVGLGARLVDNQAPTNDTHASDDRDQAFDASQAARPPPATRQGVSRRSLVFMCVGSVLLVVANVATYLLVTRSDDVMFAQQYCTTYEHFNHEVNEDVVDATLHVVVAPSLVAQRDAQSAPIAKAASTTSSLVLDMRDLARAQPPRSDTMRVADTTADQMADLARELQVLSDRWASLPVDTTEHYFAGAKALLPELTSLLFDFDPSSAVGSHVTGSRLRAALRTNAACSGIDFAS